MFQTYQYIYEVFYPYISKKGMSVVTVQNCNFYIIIAGGKNESFTAIKVMFWYKYVIRTLLIQFHEIKMNVSKTQYYLAALKRSDIDCYISLATLNRPPLPEDRRKNNWDKRKYKIRAKILFEISRFEPGYFIVPKSAGQTTTPTNTLTQFCF